MEEIQPREKLEKLKMPTVTQESAERILGKYLEIVNEIPEITDIVYAIGNAIADKFKMGTKKKKEPRKSRLGNGNRRELKKKTEMKQLK